MTQSLVRRFRLALLVGMAIQPLAQAADTDAERMMALNLYHEARSESDLGMVAVGWVVINRVADPDFPNTVVGVITEGGPSTGCQWGWYCDNQPDQPQDPQSWDRAQRIAGEMLKNPGTDPTDGGLWFHEADRSPSRWHRTLQQTAAIGNHVFYKRSE